MGDSSDEPRSAGRAKADGDPSGDAAIETILGRTAAERDQARADLALASRLRARLLDEIEHLERRLQDSEAERLELLEKVRHRDRLLSQIFESRSWRWAQALRRMMGRQ